MRKSIAILRLWRQRHQWRCSVVVMRCRGDMGRRKREWRLLKKWGFISNKRENSLFLLIGENTREAKLFAAKSENFFDVKQPEFLKEVFGFSGKKKFFMAKPRFAFLFIFSCYKQKNCRKKNAFSMRKRSWQEISGVKQRSFPNFFFLWGWTSWIFWKIWVSYGTSLTFLFF